jgi:predicted nucleic acid-binding protein
MVVVDTDVMVDVLRGYLPAAAWLSGTEADEIVVPGFVAVELLRGCKDKSAQASVERLLRPYDLAWPSPDVCAEAYSLYSRYHLSHSLAMLDALNGLLAVDLALPICTFNEKHYAVVPRLKTRQPYPR